MKFDIIVVSQLKSLIEMYGKRSLSAQKLQRAPHQKQKILRVLDNI